MPSRGLLVYFYPILTQFTDHINGGKEPEDVTKEEMSGCMQAFT